MLNNSPVVLWNELHPGQLQQNYEDLTIKITSGGQLRRATYMCSPKYSDHLVCIDTWKAMPLNGLDLDRSTLAKGVAEANHLREPLVDEASYGDSQVGERPDDFRDAYSRDRRRRPPVAAAGNFRDIADRVYSGSDQLYGRTETDGVNKPMHGPHPAQVLLSDGSSRFAAQ